MKLRQPIFEFYVANATSDLGRGMIFPEKRCELRRIPNNFQLLIQPLGGNRHGRANFLREQGDFELFNHPPKGFDLTQRLG